MKSILVLITGLLTLAACSSATGPAGRGIELGRPFALRPSEAAQLANPPLTVGLDGITSDSRCPKGEQCITAGHATVRVWWQRGAGAREVGDLHTAPPDRGARQLGDLELRLLDLTPVPISGRTIAPASYVATLMLARKDAPPADR